jgi:hypothetical protein
MIHSISELFDGVCAKYLSGVDVPRIHSNQHEIGGLVRAGFKHHLGEPSGGTVLRFPAHMAYLFDDDRTPETAEVWVSWYDTRYINENRSPEYRLYYPDNSVTENVQEGDLLVIGKKRDDSLLMLFTPADSSIEHQIRYLFGLPVLEKQFRLGNLFANKLSLPLKLLLEDLGISAIPTSDAESDLDRLLARFPEGFPSTALFSQFARGTLPLDPIAEPDETLLQWLEREEALFRAFERHYVSERLRQGFSGSGDQVDAFINYSLSVQNRRKSRVGHAFENHLSTVFDANKLRYQRGGSRRMTEPGSKPDFLFPGFSEYHDPDFPLSSLFLLGAKTTCKDRWRQVLSEGQRLHQKHLVTIESPISQTQTDEMNRNDLKLVIPRSLQAAFQPNQKPYLESLKGFIQSVSHSQI